MKPRWGNKETDYSLVVMLNTLDRDHMEFTLLAPEARRVRKKTFHTKNLGAASCRGSKGALVRAMRTRERSHEGGLLASWDALWRRPEVP